jgi:hypothetical protein
MIFILEGNQTQILSVEYHADQTISIKGLASDLNVYKAPKLPQLLELQTASIQSFTLNPPFTQVQPKPLFNQLTNFHCIIKAKLDKPINWG